MRYIWVVEFWNENTAQWEPTLGVALTRAEGRIVLANWRRSNPDDWLQLVRYWSRP